MKSKQPGGAAEMALPQLIRLFGLRGERVAVFEANIPTPPPAVNWGERRFEMRSKGKYYETVADKSVATQIDHPAPLPGKKGGGLEA